MPKNKKQTILTVAAVLAVLLFIYVGKTWAYGHAHESTENAQVDGSIVPVLAKVGGYVKSVQVEENQPVQANMPLVSIDDAEYRVKLAQATADLAAAEAAAQGGDNQAEAQVQTASGQRAALTSQVAAARAMFTKAQADLARARELVAKQIVSKQQLDAAQASADAAAANLEAAERQVTAAGAGVSGARAGVRVAEARLMAARAARDNAALQLSYTQVTAPTGGHVAEKQVEPGQLVAAGQPLLSIVSNDEVWITANFKETQLNDMKIGQSVDIDVDAYEGCEAKGKVVSVSGATGAKFALLPPDNATGNFTKVVQRVPVRIAVTKGCGDAHPLRPGMSVNVHVKTN